MLDGQTWPDFGQGIWPDFGLHEKLYTNFFEREKIYVNILNPFSQRETDEEEDEEDSTCNIISDVIEHHI